jgi:FixJ family two-component response regulator
VVHVVDDDPSVLRSVARLMRAAGFTVEVFGSAEEFLLERVRRQDTPGCVVLDLEMPGLHGLQVQEILGRLREPLPVVFLTGHGDVPSSVHALKHHAIDFLTKPVPADDLVAAVQRALDCDAEARERRSRERELLARFEELTPREREVLVLVARGLLNKQVAAELGTVERTIKAHRARVMSKMQVQSLAELVRVTDQIRDVLKRLGRPL